jgi:hypothetical protein
VLKNTGLMAISTDLAFLFGFSILTLGAATLLFRRTLCAGVHVAHSSDATHECSIATETYL